MADRLDALDGGMIISLYIYFIPHTLIQGNNIIFESLNYSALRSWKAKEYYTYSQKAFFYLLQAL